MTRQSDSIFAVLALTALIVVTISFLVATLPGVA